MGYSNTRVGTSTVTRPTLWQGSTVSDLGLLGGNSARAFGINRLGQVVGHSYLSDNTTLHAFLWVDGVLRDLNDLLPAGSGWVLNEARAINDFGQITGYGAHNGITRAFVLSPVPTTVTISLDGYTGDYSVLPLQVEVRSATTGEILLTFSATLSAAGQFSLMLTPATYHLAFKADRSLHRVLTGVTLPAGTLPVALLNGDIDGDNEVTLLDFGRLVAAFGSMPGDSGWNPSADLDGDNEVTLFDFGILVRNFGQIGDE